MRPRFPPQQESNRQMICKVWTLSLLPSYSDSGEIANPHLLCNQLYQGDPYISDSGNQLPSYSDSGEIANPHSCCYQLYQGDPRATVEQQAATSWLTRATEHEQLLMGSMQIF